MHLKLIALGLTLALGALTFTSCVANAGGPVITQEEPPEKLRDSRREGAWVVPVVGLLILGAVLIGSGGDDGGVVCQGDTPVDPC